MLKKALSLLGNSNFLISGFAAIVLVVLTINLFSTRSDLRAQEKQVAVLNEVIAKQAAEISEINRISLNWQYASDTCSRALRERMDLLVLYRQKDRLIQDIVRKKDGEIRLRDSVISSIQASGTYGPHDMLRDMQLVFK